ncbi:ATPase [Colletotrichum kahawae]|uniref:ATPase n=1 Tax=Colletotrichum kahawae TaxID=34407 RepID=A0AAE0D7Q8_COLKA|nr:ATPase [Colletotrichum kahawae]
MEPQAEELPHVHSAPEDTPKKRKDDWRSEICQFLNLSNDVNDNEIFEGLDDADRKIKDLERLETQSQVKIGPPRFQLMFNIHCHQLKPHQRNSFYLDVPWAIDSGEHGAHLASSRHIRNLDLYLERNKDISFLVIREFACCERPVAWQHTNDGQTSEEDIVPFFSREYLELVSNEMQLALKTLSESALADIEHPKFVDNKIGDISYPYLWWYHRRQQIETAKEDMKSNLQNQVNLVKDYMEDRLKNTWETVQEMTERGKITAELLEYIFMPKLILISKLDDEDVSLAEGFTNESWLEWEKRDDGNLDATVVVAHWVFMGSFKRRSFRAPLGLLPRTSKGEFSIRDLPFFPVRFAEDSVAMALRHRGAIFWECRHQRYVSYVTTQSDVMQPPAHSRFMVDFDTYMTMHPEAVSEEVEEFLNIQQPQHVSINMAAEATDLADDFIMCLPSKAMGFDMSKKEWKKLRVSFMQDVAWNDQAFEDLVIDEKTKDLVKAVVINRLREDESLDLIEGKGNGLFILLHGGPGTGKTLTAESVAEVARRPLYRVTCGDIGTRADEVEKGKKWNCVVLLDEADVFLEQRSFANLERNALVSVFLRVLEYYDGILMLTTNRVGTFDEAFKSRIQLTLRYNNLDKDQRLTIWGNFLRRLQSLNTTPRARESVSSMDYGVNISQISNHLEELAKESLNGRDIRNVISTARQLASYKQCQLEYSHLRTVIDETKRFEEYLRTLHGGLSMDEIQLDQGER